MKKVAYYLIPILACFVVGGAAAYFQQPAMNVWYPSLIKPALTPPDIVFPIAWSILYVCIGVSLGELLRRGYRRYVGLWALQLVLNFFWSILFFTLRSPLFGLIDIVLLDIVIIWYIAAVGRHSRAAAWLFVPYLIWVLFATYLNAYIYIYN